MESSQDLFKELENAEKLFSDGSIKSGQKIIKNVLSKAKSLPKIPNRLRHKIHSLISKSRYFDEISSFATNPKRYELISDINKIIDKKSTNLKKRAHTINKIQAKWQLLDTSGRPASKKQWLEFNDLTNKAWEPCKEYFDEIKEIKLNNANKRLDIINQTKIFVEKYKHKWPSYKELVIYIRKSSNEWQKYAPVMDEDFRNLKNQYSDVKKPIIDALRKYENVNKQKKEELVKKVLEINDDDNEICINKFMKLKDQWKNIDSAGKIEDKSLWDQFNNNANKFYTEKKNIEAKEIEILVKLNEELVNNKKTVSEIRNELDGVKKLNNTKEFKLLNENIQKNIEEEKLLKRNNKIKSYKNIINILMKTCDISEAPKIIQPSLELSIKNTKSNEDELLYSCLRLEMMSGIKTKKKDQKLIEKIQLELLESKFNKTKKIIPNDLDMILIYFIQNFSNEDYELLDKNIWPRINKCIEVLV